MNSYTMRLPSAKNNARKSGFSLIEILFVIGLIALLLTLVVGNIGGIFGGQQEKIAKAFVTSSIELAVVPYRLDMGSYPSSEQGLQALIKAPAGKETRWKGPYLKEAQVPLDPWGNEYKYKYPGTKNINGAKGYDVWSLGEDGVESADDIGNW
ncbi:MAG TPA: type II secretion system protein GspG [Opitutae bacterium]|nr:type II secretion system protein GspG [Opitutae bacterium]